MNIHKEGHKFLIISFLLLLIINLAVFYFLPDYLWIKNLVLIGSAILYILFLQFFRNPNVISEINDKYVLAPADGKVVVIEDTEENEYLNDSRKQISIFMSPVNVHINRNPVSGMVRYFKYHKGKYLVAWHPKSSTENERTTMVLQLKNGIEILVRQIAGAMAKRIKFYIKEGEEVKQGAEFGFIKFGSRVDVFLPLDSDIKVNIGDKTKAGKTILAVLNE
jgi:phosphatidylserine decarboxylase